jgi:hypothetical protein
MKTAVNFHHGENSNSKLKLTASATPIRPESNWIQRNFQVHTWHATICVCTWHKWDPLLQPELQRDTQLQGADSEHQSRKKRMGAMNFIISRELLSITNCQRVFLNLTKALQNHPGMVNDQTLKCWKEQEKKRVTASTWNMSQSGCINSARNRVLYATEAMWIVWDAGSRGQKSSDARINALFFELSHSVDVSNQTFNFDKRTAKLYM